MLAVLALVLAATPSVRGGDAYQRVVARSLARSRADVAARIDFDVDHSRWEDPWVVQSAHYEVRTTHSYSHAYELAKNLEFFRGEFVKLLGEGRARSGLEKVWVFPTIADYNRFGEQFAEHSSMLGSFYAGEDAEQPVATYFDGNWTRLGMWVTHSALHQYLDHAFGVRPAAFVDEGLASYFALVWDWSYGASELRQLVERRRFVPLARLVTDPLQSYGGNSHERFVELGMLFRYLLEECEATKDGADGAPGPFREFLRAAVRGQPTAATEFVQVFEADAELIEEDFRAFDFAGR